MHQNPLQKYYRQPKIFLKLPTLGKFTNPSSITGDVEKLPIFGMTGMDQIIVKTPDALLNGESTVRIIESCCPSITNAWDLSNIDINSLLVAVRIATFGTTISMGTVCSKCDTENSYDVDISHFLAHYEQCHFETTVVSDELVIKLKPLNYKQVSEFGLENFSLQKQLYQTESIENDKEKQQILSNLFSDFGTLQNKILVASIDQVETPDSVVSEYGFIKEWIDKCDQSIIEKIKKVMDLNTHSWKTPTSSVVCANCGSHEEVDIDLDNASFFANA